ncbi:delta(14)-sterol reductase TM7SF2 [Ischnura elegans]|uniref:delta(14)-sterol reductase TM7SF2 n=1 Tax=Ischnura elegans TaxID=197161 RepID=UPI001ED872C9|nr:delta(14)-sterol reductase TM7SF2 [Ischnura elegans]XP_046388887.1 delta(14)-sterol reductase TM7SF2 [Ischnura elegans]XP_046388889.1 delta(14)-sterol reductase TM7SF2 [Ischnura elegans]XP_046388890.1 delta(14)-sterol reductase TM7SF2 [Ischnura elegans]
MSSRVSRRRTIMEEPGDTLSSQKKSPTRKSVSRKSPSRKSPARKSPARKSPVKKSPARKSPARKSPSRKKTATKKLNIEDSPVIKQMEVEKIEVITRTLRPRAHVAPSFPSVNLLSNDDASSTSSRRLAAENENEDRKSVSKEPTPSLLLGRDREVTPVKGFYREVSQSRSSPSAPITLTREFGGLFGVMMIIPLMPLTVLTAHIGLSHGWNEKKFIDWLPWLWTQIDPVGVATYLAFCVIQLILSVLPIGRLVDGLPDKNGRWQYRCNGMVALFLTGITFGIAWFMKCNSVFLKLSSSKGFLSLLIGAVLWGILMSIVMVIKAINCPVSSLNPAAITRSKLYNFFMGHQLNPRIGGIIDFKFGLHRISITAMIALNTLILLGKLSHGADIHSLPYPFLACLFLQYLYALDLLWFEDQFATTFSAMSEGGGYLLCMSSALYPFIPTLITRYVSLNRMDYPAYLLCGVALIYFFGYIIYRGSNAQKNEFRKNPMNPSLAHLEVIPTTRGKKLLVTGWWGWLRHPNYLGDIIINWSWVLTCGFHSPLPFVAPILTMIALMCRAHRDGNRCLQRYNAAWERYCARVPYRVLPGVY